MLLRTPKDIGATIRQKRKELGLDQRSLAESVRVSRQWIIDVEAGKPRTELGLVLRTLEVLGLHLTVAPAKGRARRGAAPVIDARVPKRKVVTPDIDAIVRNARKRTR